MAVRVLVATVAAVLFGAAAAQAHVQVTPAQAATDDAVLFEVLVPNEQDKDTVEVALQVPPDVIPFSFEETPGWERTLEKAGNGAIDVVRWRGTVEPGGFVRFSFLAATPAEPATIAWKALQTYEGGEVVRWIGDEASDFPAATTVVSASADRANAGGEGPGETDAAPPAQPGAPPAAAPVEESRDGLTLGLAIGALVFGLVALVLAALGRRRRPETTRG